ncbi:O-antigen polymerase [Vibrio owensii]|uniref:hypothetical protein n=1 Tax=Vibrio owensii TaxID=696485 RepID=UPI002895DD6C|nr:O-antigen polymerase [Vibrio owensii]
MASIITFILLFNTAIVISPIFYQFSRIGSFAFLTLLALSVLLWFKTRKSKNVKNYFVLMFLFLFLFICASIYWQDAGLVHYPKYFIVALLIVALIDLDLKKRYINWLSWFILLQVTLALVGFIYAAFGGQPILEITITTGRPFPLYLTSFSVTKYANFIRPSGLFDEPGALSFLICFVVMLREANGFKRSFNYLILSLGLITLSLAHILFVIAYIFYCFFVLRSKQSVVLLAVSILLLFLLLPFLPNLDYITNYYISRSSSDLGGGGRSGLFETAWTYLSNSDLHVYIWGISSSCLTDYNANCRYVFPRMGENILSPLVFGGITTSWFYYLSPIVIFILALRYPYYYIIPFAFIVLFFQRPYMYNISYSLMYAFVLLEAMNAWLKVKKVEVQA